MDDGTLAEIAASFGVDATGRVDVWRERMEQDRPLLDAVRGLTPASSDFDVEGRSPGAAATESAAGPHAWDRRKGESCTERVEQALARIEANADLNAFTRIFPREALAEAGQLDSRLARGESVGPFGGAIVAVKDIMGVRGSPISGGTAAFHAVPGDDALVVARLRAAGGIIIGTANLHALAYGPFSTSSDFGAVRNPLNKAVVAGGSSGGSAAAVAAGLVDVAVGTDTAGSIRMPAALCGVVGLKPTFSLVPSRGAQPLAASLDHIGPLARTVSDAHAALDAMLGTRGNQSTPADSSQSGQNRPLTGITIGILDSYVDALLAPPIREAFEQAKELMRKLGAKVLSLPLPTLSAAPGIMLCTLGHEAFGSFRELLMHRAVMLPPDVRLRLEAGMFVTAADYAHCQLLRQDLRHEVDTAFERMDAILTPTMAVEAPLLGEVDGNQNNESTVRFRGAMNVLTLPFNLTGHPAISLPFGLDVRGAGIGMQLVGPRRSDSRLLALAATIESHTAPTRS